MLQAKFVGRKMDVRTFQAQVQQLQLGVELTLQNLELTEKCFPKCVKGEPGENLNKVESDCLTNCVGRYFATKNLVERRTIHLLEKEQEQQLQRRHNH